MSIYYLEEPYYLTHTAGSKPRNDLNYLFKKIGYSKITENSITNLGFLKEDDIIIFLYTLSGQWQYVLLDYCVRNKIKSILIVLDIVSLQSGDYSNIDLEINFFNLFTHLVIQSESMEKWLLKNNIKPKMTETSIFDYILDEEAYNNIPQKKLTSDIVFAGNLNEQIRAWIYDSSLNLPFNLHLYGPHLSSNYNPYKKKYYGSFAPEEIPVVLDGSFGLLWNGNGVNPIEDKIGYYGTIATPHKLSLYLVSKLPVICWSQASEAKFVKQNNIGLIVDSLLDINSQLASLSESEYKQMIMNVEEIAKLLIKGQVFEEAIKKAILTIDSDYQN